MTPETMVWILIHHVTDVKSKILGVYGSEAVALMQAKLAKDIGYGEFELIAHVVSRPEKKP